MQVRFKPQQSNLCHPELSPCNSFRFAVVLVKKHSLPCIIVALRKPARITCGRIRNHWKGVFPNGTFLRCFGVQLKPPRAEEATYLFVFSSLRPGREWLAHLHGAGGGMQCVNLKGSKGLGQRRSFRAISAKADLFPILRYPQISPRNILINLIDPLLTNAEVWSLLNCGMPLLVSSPSLVRTCPYICKMLPESSKL